MRSETLLQSARGVHADSLAEGFRFIFRALCTVRVLLPVQ